MKVLFISKDLLMEPLGIMYLSSSLKARGHQTDLVTLSQDVEGRIKNFAPDVAAFSIMTGDQALYASAISKLRKSHPELFFVAGGPHPTFFPEFLEQSALDAICRGEAEEAFPELLDKLQEKRDYTQTKNFWFKTHKGIEKNPVRPFVENLDSLPFPDRDLVYTNASRTDIPIRHFIASRGCPYDCTYCFNHANAELYKEEAGDTRRARFRGVENLLQEIKEVTSTHPTKIVYFQDDTFILNKKNLRQFADAYPSAIGIPFHAHVRANLVDDATVQALARAGCSGVHIAAETADDYLRNTILNRDMSREQIVSAVKRMKQAGIKVMLQNMIGLPEGSLEKDLETLRMNIKCQPDYAWVSIYQPYPGTRLGQHCVANGFYTGDFSDIGSNFYDGSVLNFSPDYKQQLVLLQRLFGTTVDNPWLLESSPSPLLKWLQHPPGKEAIDAFSDMQKAYRAKCDEKMFGKGIFK